MRYISYIIILILLAGCGASTEIQFAKKDVKLSDYRKQHVVIMTSGGGVSLSSVGFGSGSAVAKRTGTGAVASGSGTSISVQHALPSDDQIFMAGQDIAFGLTGLGFNVVDREEDADMLALFSIGTVRFDPLAGWIADRAILQFKDRTTGEGVLTIKADLQFITPTVSTLVENLLDEVEEIVKNERLK
jgi:hypothetical protein